MQRYRTVHLEQIEHPRVVALFLATSAPEIGSFWRLRQKSGLLRVLIVFSDANTYYRSRIRLSPLPRVGDRACHMSTL